MGATLYPLLLVDKYDVSASFVGIYTATSAAFTMLGFLFWGRRIDRGSSLSITTRIAALTLGLPAVYLLAPDALFLLLAAALAGFAIASGDLIFFTNVVELAPPGRAGDYMNAQSFALGLRGTVAPFVASALLLAIGATALLLVVIALIAAGTLLFQTAARRAAVQPRVAERAPA